MKPYKLTAVEILDNSSRLTFNVDGRGPFRMSDEYFLIKADEADARIDELEADNAALKAALARANDDVECYAEAMDEGPRVGRKAIVAFQNLRATLSGPAPLDVVDTRWCPRCNAIDPAIKLNGGCGNCGCLDVDYCTAVVLANEKGGE